MTKTDKKLWHVPISRQHAELIAKEVEKGTEFTVAWYDTIRFAAVEHIPTRHGSGEEPCKDLWAKHQPKPTK
jgi:(2Fe-2S) ferredoxin